MANRRRTRLMCPGLFACYAALFAVVLALPQTVRAAEQPLAGDRAERARTGLEPSLSEKLRRRGDLTLREMPLREALLTISQQWDVNLVVGIALEGTVSGAFIDAPLSEILDAVLLSHGYSYRPVGRTLVVLPLEALGELNPLFESAVLPVERGGPAELLESVRLLSSPQGKVEAIPAARSLLVVDFPDRVEMIRRFLGDVNRAAATLTSSSGRAGPEPLQVMELRPQYVTAAAVEPALKHLLSEDGKLAAVQGENLIVVTDYADRLEAIRQSLKRLDVPRRQVRIMSLIYDIDLEDLENLGINWSSDVQGRYNSDGEPQSIFSANTLLQAAPLPGTPDGAFTFFNLSRHFDLDTVVRALHQSKYSRLLADPSVTVVENEKALMSIVEEIPYQQLTQTSAGGNIGTTAFREAGVKLEVTPRVADDGTVEMQVVPSFSRLTGFTPGENPQPIIDKREAQTTVRVANGQTLVIGGLRTRQDIRDRDGIPYLERINVLHLGTLFRGREFQTRESELVVFLRPHIVSVVCSSAPREEQAERVGVYLLDSVPAATIGPGHCVPLPEVGAEGEMIVSPPVEMVDPTIQPDALPTPATDGGPQLPGASREGGPAGESVPTAAVRLDRLPAVGPSPAMPYDTPSRRLPANIARPRGKVIRR